GFREDLYHRLKVVSIRLPALKERREDIALLSAHFIREFNASYGKNVTTIAEPVRRAVRTHAWPGEGRRGRKVLARLVVPRRGAGVGRRAGQQGAAGAGGGRGAGGAGGAGGPAAGGGGALLRGAGAGAGEGQPRGGGAAFGDRRADAVSQHPAVEEAGPRQGG